jgi:very-short-patch-repair endonuclease
MSIYDLAKTSFEGMICLREHFRCVSQIIQFSNYLSYNGDIKPLRDASAVARRPHTIAYRVEGEGVDAKGVNEQEAYTIASLLIACTEQPEYEDASFGVISLVGEQQAGFIEKLLRRFLPPAEYVRRRLQSGNSANFQGDERDVMFLSVVDTPGGDGPLSLRREGAQNLFKKRFNVAASRARDQMWVVYSLDPEIHLQPEDIRRRLIMHARDPDAISRERERQEANVESEFERQVLGRLLQAGYRVTPQWKVGAYRIDLVVEGNGKRLAVECDGDRWHPPEKLQEDLERQAILERLGWRFARIRGSQFFRDPDTAMRHVFERIEQLGISAEGMRLTEPEDQMTTNALKDQIIRRAAELRRQWRDAGEDAVIHPGRGSGSLRSRQRKRRGTKTDSGHDQTQNRDSTAKSGTPLDEQPPQLPSLGMRQQRKI